MVAFRLSQELAKLGNQVHYISYDKPWLYEEEEIDNLSIHKINQSSYALFSSIGNLYTINLANALAKLTRKYEMRVINSHYAIPHSISAYFAKQIKPFNSIVTLHGSDTHTLGVLESFHELLSLSLQNTERITCVSHYLAELAEKTFDLSSKPSVIYNFVDTNRFAPGGVEREKIILHASNFREVKRIPFLIDIFAEVCKDYPDWNLRIIGDGPERIKCIRKVRKLGIQKYVNFIDPILNIPQEFAKAAIIAVPSKLESFGLTIAEGMATQTPIWATNAAGIPEVCKNKENGLLFDVNDKEQAEEYLCNLMDSESLRKKMGIAGRARIMKQFGIEKIVPQYTKIFEDFSNV